METIIYTDTQSMEEIDILELNSRHAQWFYPMLIHDFSSFFSACRLLKMYMYDLDSQHPTMASPIEEKESRKDASLYYS